MPPDKHTKKTAKKHKHNLSIKQNKCCNLNEIYQKNRILRFFIKCHTSVSFKNEQTPFIDIQ